MNKNKTVALLAAASLCAATSPISAQDNYIKTETAVSESANITSIQYYDGLGRPSVAATNATTGSSAYIYSLQTYDASGRVAETWLPGKSGTPSTCPSAENVQLWSKSTNNNDSRTFTHTEYDVLDRPVAVQGPGANWNGKAFKTSYSSNASKSVKRYTAPITSDALKQNGYYDAGTLYMTTTTDEDGRSLTVFTDLQGKKVLERRNGNNDTYFVYNDYDELRFVLSPGYQQCSNLHDYGYEYRYDERSRCNYKRLPGCEPVRYTYDSCNRLATEQDGAMAARGQVRYFLYDQFNRLAAQGLCSNVTQVNATAKIVSDGKGICGTNYDFSPVPNTSYGTPSGTVTLEMATYFDDYSFLGTFPQNVFTAGDASCSVARPTGRQSVILDEATGKNVGYEYTVWHYDEWGNCTEETSTHRTYNYNESSEHSTAVNRKRVTTMAYSYTNKPVRRVTKHFANLTAKTPQYTETEVYTYTAADQLKKATHQLNNGPVVTIVGNTYDNIGRLKTATHGSTSKLTTSYAYNVRSQLVRLSSPLFSETLEYEKPTVSGAVAQYGGNISAVKWTSYDRLSQSYAFTYDKLDRLTKSSYAMGTSKAYKGRYDEQMTYDANGNITHLTRWGTTDEGITGKVDDVDFFYNGNQLQQAYDYAHAPTYKDAFHYSDQYYDPWEVNTEYKYDENGRMTQNLDNNISLIQYNSLNLPRKIEFTDNSTIENTYGAMGNKIATLYSINTMAATLPQTTVMQGCYGDSWHSWLTSWAGNLELENGTPRRLYINGGHIDLGNKVYYFNVTDHLGSVRAVTDENGDLDAVQGNEYYALGGLIGDRSMNPDFQSYKFQGKEFDRIHGLNWNDHGARFADLTMCRWTTMDPLAEKYYHMSPYAFCGNNFVKCFDPDGKEVRDGTGPYTPTTENTLGNEGFKALASYLARHDDPNSIMIVAHGVYNSKNPYAASSINIRTYNPNTQKWSDNKISNGRQLDDFLSRNSKVWQEYKNGNISKDDLHIVFYSCGSADVVKKISSDEAFEDVTFIAPNKKVQVTNPDGDIVRVANKTKDGEMKGNWETIKNGRHQNFHTISGDQNLKPGTKGFDYGWTWHF